MGESGPEEFRPTLKPIPRQEKHVVSDPGRRALLKVAGGGAVALVLSRLLNRLTKDTGRGLLGDEEKTEPPKVSTGTLEAPAKNVAEVGEAWATSPRFEEVFANLKPKEKGVARSTVDEMKYEVLYPHSSYKDMMAVTNTFQPEIAEAAAEFNLPFDLVSGMVFIENGGGVAHVSKAGAFGPAQLMVNTAIEMGLRVDEDVDERTDTNKCFKAMSGYLDKQRDFFGGNLGFAIWAYHAGPGNVGWAIQEYLIDAKGIDIGNLKDAYNTQDQIAIKRISGEIYKWVSDPELKLNVHHVLSNPRVVEKVIPQLEDETELYVYKAIAGAEIFAEQNVDSNSAKIAQE